MKESKIKTLQMKAFPEMEYKRPDLKKTEEDFNKALEKFDNAAAAKEQIEAVDEIEQIKAFYYTMSSLSSARHSINTKDDFYEKENNFCDENSPFFSKLEDSLTKRLLKTKFRKELEEEFGATFFKMLETAEKTFKPEIMEDLALENKLSSEYSKLIASAELKFHGKIYNLAQIAPFMQSEDRKVRKEASEVFYGFFVKSEKELDRIYDELVKVRTKIAEKLGYKNFVQLGYDRMMRVDYNAQMVAKYREQILKDVVPLSEELKKRQQKRLGLDKMFYYDGGLQYTTGNAVPQGEPDWIVEQAKKMYAELSPETNEFFTFMTKYKMLDLLSKPGKAGGGYCTNFPLYKSPFIFANFNKTQHDVEVMTHEAGHAFQNYQSRNVRLISYQWPTYEAAEIHSMSMEFFTWRWMDLFFKHQTEKFKFTHLSGAVSFLPYGASVDEFQHWVYENPEASPAERKLKWREIEKKYLPSLDYEENDYLLRGGRWMQQSHIFKSPFYYIDYTLAQICALQFWIKDGKNHNAAWEDYLRLCKTGGCFSFLKLLEIANLKNPFEEGCISSIMPECKKWLDSIDDTKL